MVAQAEFAPLRVVDGSLIPWPPHINVTLSPQHAGWTFKAFALYSTSFKEVQLPPDSLEGVTGIMQQAAWGQRRSFLVTAQQEMAVMLR